MGFARQTSRKVAGIGLAAALLGAALGQGTASAQETPAASAPQAKAKRTANAPVAAKPPETVQAAIEAAGQLLDAGKSDQAVERLTAAIASSNLPTPLMARALYLRGKAYRQQAKPALAISDLTSALWLKNGLNPADRTEATLQRANAYSEAGLTEHGQALASSSAAASPAPAPSFTTTSRAVRSGVVGRAPDAAPALVTALVPGPVPAAPKPQRAQVSPATATIATATIQAPPRQAPAKTADVGQFQSRVALVRTRPEADAVVAKLKDQFAAALANRSPEIGQTSFGNMGSFFQVRVGPFSTVAEAKSLCGRLRGSGLDCVAVDQ